MYSTDVRFMNHSDVHSVRLTDCQRIYISRHLKSTDEVLLIYGTITLHEIVQISHWKRKVGNRRGLTSHLFTRDISGEKQRQNERNCQAVDWKTILDLDVVASACVALVIHVSHRPCIDDGSSDTSRRHM